MSDNEGRTFAQFPNCVRKSEPDINAHALSKFGPKMKAALMRTVQITSEDRDQAYFNFPN